MEKISIEEEKDYFGPLFPYVKDEEITDIDFNGRELWLTDSRNARRLCEDVKLPEDFVDTFTKRVANTVSRPFHKQSPVLEAETDTLRITIVHESVAISGRSFCIRKSL
ncbi:MAG: pilus assembly protein, partial [Lachnospiraceae bacterium]|nr:pilus assembly protein [Lachnospiraceae bacterium]